MSNMMTPLINISSSSASESSRSKASSLSSSSSSSDTEAEDDVLHSEEDNANTDQNLNSNIEKPRRQRERKAEKSTVSKKFKSSEYVDTYNESESETDEREIAKSAPASPAPLLNRKILKCTLCDYVSSKKSNLKRHAKVHLSNNPAGTLQCPEDNCESKFTYLENLDNHLSSEHGIEIEVESLIFPEETSFNSWQQKLHETYSIKYNRKGGSRHIGQGTMFKYCHRSSHSQYNNDKKIKVGPRLRGPRKKGLLNCGKICISRIRITSPKNEPGTVHVKFWKTHTGHTVTINANQQVEQEFEDFWHQDPEPEVDLGSKANSLWSSALELAGNDKEMLKILNDGIKTTISLMESHKAQAQSLMSSEWSPLL